MVVAHKLLTNFCTLDNCAFRVLCGVLGKKKWQFDVQSNDVKLANHMEQSGIPGRIHITEDTLRALDNQYEVEIGNGHLRDTYIAQRNMNTYFVIPPRGRLRNQSSGATIIADDTIQPMMAPTNSHHSQHHQMQSIEVTSSQANHNAKLIARECQTDGQKSLQVNSGGGLPATTAPLAHTGGDQHTSQFDYTLQRQVLEVSGKSHSMDETTTTNTTSTTTATTTTTTTNPSLFKVPINNNSDATTTVVDLSNGEPPLHNSFARSKTPSLVSDSSQQPKLRFRDATRRLMNALHFIQTIDAPFSNLDLCIDTSSTSDVTGAHSLNGAHSLSGTSGTGQSGHQSNLMVANNSNEQGMLSASSSLSNKLRHSAGHHIGSNLHNHDNDDDDDDDDEDDDDEDDDDDDDDDVSKHSKDRPMKPTKRKESLMASIRDTIRGKHLYRAKIEAANNKQVPFTNRANNSVRASLASITNHQFNVSTTGNNSNNSFRNVPRHSLPQQQLYQMLALKSGRAQTNAAKPTTTTLLEDGTTITTTTQTSTTTGVAENKTDRADLEQQCDNVQVSQQQQQDLMRPLQPVCQQVQFQEKNMDDCDRNVNILGRLCDFVASFNIFRCFFGNQAHSIVTNIDYGTNQQQQTNRFTNDSNNHQIIAKVDNKQRGQLIPANNANKTKLANMTQNSTSNNNAQLTIAVNSNLYKAILAHSRDCEKYTNIDRFTLNLSDPTKERLFRREELNKNERSFTLCLLCLVVVLILIVLALVIQWAP